jgi:hypothetical protein
MSLQKALIIGFFDRHPVAEARLAEYVSWINDYIAVRGYTEEVAATHQQATKELAYHLKADAELAGICAALDSEFAADALMVLGYLDPQLALALRLMREAGQLACCLDVEAKKHPDVVVTALAVAGVVGAAFIANRLGRRAA